MNVHELTLQNYTAASGCPSACQPILYLGTAGSYGNEQLAVTLGKGWDGLTVTATFQPAGVTVLVPGDGTFDVPWEATKTALDAAKGRIVFEGVMDGRVLISTDIPYVVGSHSDTEGGNSQPPTPSEWEQFVNEVKGDADRAEKAADKAESASVHAPQVNPDTGYWQVWDAVSGQYVDTDTKAEGPQGPKGDTGETGPQGPKGDPGFGVPQPAASDAGKVPVVNAEGNGYVLQNISTGGGGTGEAGADGGYYTPSVAQDGTLSWTPSDPAMPDVPSANIKGPKGDTGPQGEPGAPGQDGQDGTAATITVGTVTTLEPGQPATVTNAGSETAAVFNFGIPKGEPGEDGSAGLPTPTAADAGKALAVKPDGTGYQLAGPYAPLSAAIRPTASGNPVSITDSVEWPLQGLKVYGKSTQDGTPSPENPVPIVSAGESGSIAVTVSDGADQSQQLVISTPNGLPGIPVDSGGNYTDASGQQWLCNYRDYGRGVDVGGNVNTIIFDGSSDKSFYRASPGFQTEPVFVFYIPTDIWAANNIDGLSNQYVAQTVLNSGNILQNGHMWTRSEYFGKAIAVRNDAIASESEMKTFLQSNPLIFVLNGNGNPIETPIPPEELAAYRALHTYDGTTVVSTAEDVTGLEVKYVADAQKYIDNRLAAAESHIQEIAAAQLNAQTGG